MNQHDFPLLSRMGYYYAGAEFLPCEIKVSTIDIQNFMNRPNLKSASQVEMRKFIDVAHEALRCGLGLEARVN